MGYTVKYICLHGTGWPASLDYWIANYKTAGVTYMIGKDGRVVQFVREHDMHWGNGKIETGAEAFWYEWKTSNPAAMTIPGVVNPNLTTISIEHEKWSKTNAESLTPAQSKASFDLCRHLAGKYNIPLRRARGMDGGFVPHSSMEPVSRSYCPGPYPWEEMFDHILGWKDDGEHLAAPNGIVVQ
jgi:N-acetyl-anhydromuramyl-L-alanine amidase AmpD